MVSNRAFYSPVDVLNDLESLKKTIGEMQLYAIVDTASDPLIYTMLSKSDAHYYCLFQKGIHFPGDLITQELAEAAPYLVLLSLNDSFTQELIQAGWGKNWFTLFFSNSMLYQIKNHLSKMLIVYNAQGEKCLYRYYDPRVLQVKIPSCGTDGLADYFCFVKIYIVEDSQSNRPVIFSMQNNTLDAGYLSGEAWVIPDIVNAELGE